MLHENTFMQGTELTLKMGDKTLKFETPSSSLTVNDIIEAFYGLMIGHTYHPQSITRAMIVFGTEMEESFISESNIETESNLEEE